MAQQDERPWVLYFHGNASTIASNVNISHYRELRNLGLNVCAAEYRGFAGLPGLPTEAALDTDARVAVRLPPQRAARPANRIVLFGWSLGSGVAVDLATTVDHAAVILEGTPASQSSLEPASLSSVSRCACSCATPSTRAPRSIGSTRRCCSCMASTTRSCPLPRGAACSTRRGPTSASSSSAVDTSNLVETDPRGFSMAIRRFLDEHGLGAARSCTERPLTSGHTDFR